MKPHNVSTPRKRKDGKTFWMKVGAAWPRDDGGFKIDLDALPIPDAEGKVMLLVSPPKEYEDVASGDQPARGSHGEIDDEIPF